MTEIATLQINTLGGISVTRGGERYEDKLSHKSTAILALLLSAPGLRMSKLRLAMLLWADSEPIAARSNVRFNLWSIRKFIGQDAAKHELIITDRDTIFINPEYAFESDILAVKSFDRLKAFDITAVEHIRGLFRGDYLEGFYLSDCEEFLELVLAERISCQKINLDILELVYNHYRGGSEHRACIEAMSEALRIDPFSENYAGRILEHMAAAGQLPQAINYYKDFALRLRKNLNIAPSAGLHDLYQVLITAQKDKGEPTDVIRPHAAPTASAAEDKGGDALIATIACIPGIDYYWMSECIDRVLDAAAITSLDEITPDALPELAFIYPPLRDYVSAPVEPRSSIHEIRLYYALRELLSFLSRCRRIEIVTCDAASRDKASELFMEYMKKKPLPRVRFTLHN